MTSSGLRKNDIKYLRNLRSLCARAQSGAVSRNEARRVPGLSIDIIRQLEIRLDIGQYIEQDEVIRGNIFITAKGIQALRNSRLLSRIYFSLTQFYNALPIKRQILHGILFFLAFW